MKTLFTILSFISSISQATEMTTHRETLARDLETLKSLEFDSKKIEEPFARYYEKIIGGSNGLELQKYIGKRIKFVSTQSELASLFPISETANAIPMPSSFIAFNMSTPLFFHKLQSDIKHLYQGDADSLSVLDSTRPGMVILGSAFDDLENIQGISSIRRIFSLIHEARHADCGEKPRPSQIEKLKSQTSFLTDPSILWDFENCGYAHKICPAGHDLEGAYACDDNPWGSYGVAALAGLTLLQTWSPEYDGRIEESEVMASTADLLSRLPEPLLDSLSAGKLQDPQTFDDE
jgi:hypothetical protein